MINFSEDLRIIRHAKGIKLVKTTTQPDAYTIGSLNQLPFSVYFLNPTGETCFINHEGAKVCGFVTPDQSLGKSLLAVTKTESAERLIHNCSEVIETESTKIFEEENVRKDDVSLQFLSVKAPWYDDAGHVIGVMGCSIVLGCHSLAESLSTIKKLGLLDAGQSLQQVPKDIRINDVYLSARELQCLRLTVKGYTAKKIAKELGISHRTVEEYIGNIRVKAGAGSKAELIGMSMENFMLGE